MLLVLLFCGSFCSSQQAVRGRRSHQRRMNCTVLKPFDCEAGLVRPCAVGPHSRHNAFFRGMVSHAATTWHHGFAFVRYADGEISLIRGNKIGKDSQAYLVDKFWSDGGPSQIGADLKESLSGHYGENYYYGFASPVEESSDLLWFLENTEQRCDFISYSNLWINAFYPETKSLLETLIFVNHTKTVVIANHAGVRRLKEAGKVKFLSMELPDSVNTVWGGSTRDKLIRNASTLAQSVHRHVFLVSGGPMAKVLISYMWKTNKNNMYIDFGSAMDEVLKGYPTRPYMSPKNYYAKQMDPSWYIGGNNKPYIMPI